MKLKYKDAIINTVFEHSKEITSLSSGANTVLHKEGFAPMPSWISKIAETFKKSGNTVFDDLIKYNDSFGYQLELLRRRNRK
jgi:hypothetical protein